jgi:hypothetical protein
LVIVATWTLTEAGALPRTRVNRLAERDLCLVVLKEISRPGIIIERSSFKLPHPDSDDVARDVVSAGKSMQRLACNEVLSDLPFELDAVGAVTYIRHEYNDVKGRVELQRHVVAQLHMVEGDASEAEAALNALLDDEACKLRILDYLRKKSGQATSWKNASRVLNIAC